MDVEKGPDGDGPGRHASRPASELRRVPAAIAGAGWMVLSALAGVAVVAAIRFAAAELHAFEITFFRCLIGAAVLAPVLFGVERRRLPQRAATLIVGRALLVAAAMVTSFQALIVMPVLTATVLFFTAPFFAAIGAAVVFREAVGGLRWAALATGFAGTLLIVRPGFEGVGVGIALAVGSAVLSGAGWLCLKPLSRRMDALPIVALTTAAMIPVAFLPAVFVWKTPSAETFAWLAVLGVAGSVSQWAVTRAFAVTDVGFAVAFEFLNVAAVAALGALVFGEPVPAASIMGGIAIVGAAIVLTRRESERASGAP